MKMKLGKHTWEYSPSYTVDDFLRHNMSIIANDYLRFLPENAHCIDDGEYEAAWQHAGDNLDYYREVMVELYQDFLEQDIPSY